MKCETLSSHLPSVPSFAVYSRRYDVIYSGNPFSAYGLKTSSQVPRLAFQGVADTVCVSRDERNVAISSSALIKLYDVDSGREIRNLAGHSLPVHAICPRRNSIYNWFSGSLDSSWIMWDIRCHPAKVLDGRASGPIRCLDISPDDSILAVGTDSSLQLFDIRNRQMLNRFGYSSNEVSFNPAEKLLASVGVDRIVRFICMDQMECVSVSDPLYGEIRGISFAGSSPDTDFLVACTDLELRILTWEPCDTLSSCQLPTGHHVLNVSLGDDSVDLISYNTDGALSLVSYSVEEVLTGEIVSLDQSSPIPSTPSPPSSEPEEPAMAPVLIARPPVQEKSETRISTAVRKPHRAATTTERLSAKEKVTTRPRSPSANCIPPIDPNNKRPKTPEESTLKNSRSNSNSRHSLAGNRAPSPAVKLSSEKKPLSRKASPSEEKPKQSVSIDVWVSKFETKGKKAMKDSKLRIQNIRQAESAIRRFGLEEAAAKEVIFYDSFILKTVLSHYNSHHLWDIGLVHRYLPRIKDLLDDSSCTVSCLESLECICDGLLDKLVKNAQYFSAIGVDVTAEERRERSEECLKTFRQIRDSRNSYYKKLSEENYLRLDNIIAKFKKL